MASQRRFVPLICNAKHLGSRLGLSRVLPVRGPALPSSCDSLEQVCMHVRSACKLHGTEAMQGRILIHGKMAGMIASKRVHVIWGDISYSKVGR